jgi:hypothetical protein
MKRLNIWDGKLKENLKGCINHVNLHVYNVEILKIFYMHIILDLYTNVLIAYNIIV